MALPDEVALTPAALSNGICHYFDCVSWRYFEPSRIQIVSRFGSAGRSVFEHSSGIIKLADSGTTADEEFSCGGDVFETAVPADAKTSHDIKTGPIPRSNQAPGFRET